jgi:hypothetical protein
MSERLMATSNLTPDVLERIRGKLNKPEKYTDEELSMAAWFIVSSALIPAAMVGVADIPSFDQIYVVSNLLAGSILADFINGEAIDPTAIKHFTDEATTKGNGSELPV